jgi:2-polyprenyl-3-methyl-5-hydroxy-6-metoxy-1,4-benzoquinol methylase
MDSKRDLARYLRQMSIRDSARRGGAVAPAGDSADAVHALYDLPVGQLPSRAPHRAAPCPICRGVRGIDLYTVATEAPDAALRGNILESPSDSEGLYTLIRCPACGHGRLDPMPELDEIHRFYPDDYYGTPGQKFRPLIEGIVRFVGRRHVRFLARDMAAGSSVLDVGCGRGVLLGPLADEGLSVHGFEISEEACRGADARAEIRVGEDLREANYADAAFDLVVIWHVLEHLRDPRATLEEIHRILRPGGRLVVAVPNFASWQARWSGPAWFHLDLPRHLHHFTSDGLSALLKELGFLPRSAHHFSLRQNPFGWIQSALNRLEFLPRNGLYAILHRRPAQSNGAASPRPVRPGSAIAQLLFFSIATPFALALALAATAARSGGTIHLVAERKASS